MGCRKDMIETCCREVGIVVDGGKILDSGKFVEAPVR